MAARIGITCDFEKRKSELEREWKNPRNWKLTDPMASKKEAKQWEKKKADELGVKTVEPDTDQRLIRPKWQGFYFEHDGPR